MSQQRSANKPNVARIHLITRDQSGGIFDGIKLHEALRLSRELEDVHDPERFANPESAQTVRNAEKLRPALGRCNPSANCERTQQGWESKEDERGKRSIPEVHQASFS